MAIVPLISNVRSAPTIAAVAAALALLTAALAAAQPGCEDWPAEVVTAEGTVEIKRASSNDWVSAERNTALCIGDSLRVLELSRATLKLRDDPVLLRLDENSSMTFAEPEEASGSLLNLLWGLIHVISRDPRAIRFTTPYANAGLEGTEFVIAASAEQTSITVLEGEVVMSSPAGSVSVASGQQGTARSGAAPQAVPIADAIEQVRWSAYASSIVDSPLPAADRLPTAAEANDATFFVRRAAQRLGQGRLVAAEADLQSALTLSANEPTAYALRAVIALERNDVREARQIAERAVASAPELAAARLALARVHERDGEPTAALQELHRAVEAEPTNATAWARLAEMLLADGNAQGSVTAANRALQLNSSLGDAHTVLGFAQLTGMRSVEAIRAFEDAIELDPLFPLPRLGLALALVQHGELTPGRQALETAVMLDPTDALARSYMAKVYHAERRESLTETQLQLARALDPNDPTPWIYDALRKNAQNRPAEAFGDLQRAFDLNGQRMSYRSRLLVDEDLATRSAGFGRLYRELGFEAVALSRGWRSLAADPTDHASHRLLADVYSTLPRHELARVSELYQAQMLQPVNLIPISPDLAEVGQFIARTVAPIDPAFAEFYPLVSRNGLRLQGSAVTAAADTHGESFAVSGLRDELSYGGGHFHFTTNGFRVNNDLEQRLTSAFVHFRPTIDTSLRAEVRTTDTSRGDLLWLFDPADFNPALRQHENVDTIRLGVRHSVPQGVLLASLAYQEADLTLTSSAPLSFIGSARIYDLDVQHIGRWGRWSTRSGAAFFDQDGHQQTVLQGPPPEAIVTVSDIRGSKRSAYAYATRSIAPRVEVTIGASLNEVRGRAVAETTIDPKFGLVWQFSDRTNLRAAAFKTIQGPLISPQNAQPRLEPVDVAGFNQFFFGTEGEKATRYGIGLDHRFDGSVYGGLEASRRTSEFPVKIVQPPLPDEIDLTVDTSEELHRAYLYWTPTDTLALSAEYQYERFDNHGMLFNGYTEMTAQRLPLEARYFHPSGFSASLRGTHVRQSGLFSGFLALLPEAMADAEYGADEFWIFDASLGYRLPNRRGIVSLNVGNLFDKEFRFQDTDPQNSEFLPERMLYLRFTLAFD